MDLNLKGKKAIVTGASRGIGLGIVKGLREEGVDVTSIARTDADCIIDLSLSDGAARLKELGDVDIVVNNLGGTLDVKNPLCGMKKWDDVMRLNFLVAVEVNEIFIPKMIKKKWGRIINVCSTSSLENNGPVTYCTAKAALAAYTRSMGRVLAKDGIVMTGLIVGAVNTKGGFWENQTQEHIDEYLRTRCPYGKFGTEKNISDLAVFLASERAEFMAGALVPVDGAQSRHFFGEV